MTPKYKETKVEPSLAFCSPYPIKRPLRHLLELKSKWISLFDFKRKW
jgi:hypothetical protein